jgi:hypothetical protein
MKTSKAFLFVFALFIACQSFGQNFIIQETNVKKNLTQCINLTKKAGLVLLGKQTAYTIPFSNKSTLTAVAIRGLSEKYTVVFPKENNGKGDARVIERPFADERNQIVKLMYGHLTTGQNATTNYAQVVVYFDNSGTSPTINDIQVKNKVDLGIITLTSREVLKLTEPEPKPVTKPATKPAAKPATKKPAAKKKA